MSIPLKPHRPHMPGGPYRARAAAVGLLGVLLLALGAGGASAAPTIDPDAEGSITIHKYEQAEYKRGERLNGSEITDGSFDTLTPLDGVEFTIHQVTSIDLSTNDGWVAAWALQDQLNLNSVNLQNPEITDHTLGTPVDETTAGGGLATFAQLDVGLYLVTETGTPAGFTPAAAFLISVPLTVDGSWLYDVHAYPKNVGTTATKTVVDWVDSQPSTPGDQVTYTIAGGLRPQTTDAYRIDDLLDPRLTFDPAADPSDVTVHVTGAPGFTLEPVTDYTVTFTPGATATDPDLVRVELTGSGRSWVAGAREADVDAVLVVELTVTVNAPGEIPNTASVYSSRLAIDNDTPTVTEAVLTKWGTVNVAKTSSSGAADLEGAEFEIYWTSTPIWDQATANRVVVDGVDTWTTNASGVFPSDVNRVRYSDFANGKSVANADLEYRHYWLLETVPIPGHEMLAHPIRFTIDDGATTATTHIDIDVVNVPTNGGFELPFTGGVGTIWFTTAGALLLAGSLLLLVRARRSRA